MQHCRHKSKFRSADYILIAAFSGDTTTLSGEAAVKPKNLKNLRAGGPSNFFSEPSEPFFTYPSLTACNDYVYGKI